MGIKPTKIELKEVTKFEFVEQVESEIHFEIMISFVKKEQKFH